MPQAPATFDPHNRSPEDRERTRKREFDRFRESSTARGYGHAWRKARKGHIRNHPICVLCWLEGIVTPATVVDHIKPHRGDPKLFWDRNNWQSLCKRHHDSKTAREDSNFTPAR